MIINHWLKTICTLIKPHSTRRRKQCVPLYAQMEQREKRTLLTRTTLNVLDATVVEGDEGQRFIEFRVQATGRTARNVTFNYATEERPRARRQFRATSGVDFEEKVRTHVRFTEGRDRTQIVRVKVNGDRRIEQDETFKLFIWDARNANIGDDTGKDTIRMALRL
jgi:hypothetical protein